MATAENDKTAHGLSTAECLLYATYRLETFANGLATGTGTGFLYAFPYGDTEIAMMVTNKHVVEGCREIRIRFHLGTDFKPNGETMTVNFVVDQNNGMGIIHHPDPSVDLCCFPIESGLRRINEHDAMAFFVSIRETEIPTEDEWQTFDSIENVEMVGCPRGIFDPVSNLPIARRGITATPVGRRFEGRPEFMVDMACFPGSSGSPIFLRDTGAYYNRGTNGYHFGNGRIKLLGVLYKGPVIDQNGELVLNGLPSVRVAAMMHLGQAIRSSEIRILQQALIEKIQNQG